MAGMRHHCISAAAPETWLQHILFWHQVNWAFDWFSNFWDLRSIHAHWNSFNWQCSMSLIGACSGWHIEILCHTYMLSYGTCSICGPFAILSGNSWRRNALFQMPYAPYDIFGGNRPNHKLTCLHWLIADSFSLEMSCLCWAQRLFLAQRCAGGHVMHISLLAF